MYKHHFSSTGTWQLAYKKIFTTDLWRRWIQPVPLCSGRQRNKPATLPWPNSLPILTGKVSTEVWWSSGSSLVPNRKNSVSQIQASQAQAAFTPLYTGSKDSKTKGRWSRSRHLNLDDMFQALEQSGGSGGHPDLTSGEERNLSVLKD